MLTPLKIQDSLGVSLYAQIDIHLGLTAKKRYRTYRFLEPPVWVHTIAVFEPLIVHLRTSWGD